MSALQSMTWSIDRQILLPLLLKVHSRWKCDVFLSGGPRAVTNWNYVGIGPVEELLIDRTERTDIKAFVFRNSRPVLGFLSYTLGMKGQGGLKNINPGFPLGMLRRYKAGLVWSPQSERLVLDTEDTVMGRQVKDLVDAYIRDPRPAYLPGFEQGPRKLTQSMSKHQYIRGVKRIIEAIRSGAVYQVSFSLRFDAGIDPKDAFPLFLELFDQHPASHYAYMDLGNIQLISTSPERFLRVEDRRVLSQPIKGTAKVPPGRDTALWTDQLRSSPKESAELSMIVDLVRNDISINCEVGTVQVSGHKSVFQVDDLLQMYTNVTGKLALGRDWVDLVIDAFPGGSVTGCPKASALRVIDDLENISRDIYCGSFIMARGRDLESSIAIRTGYVDASAQKFSFYAGSGIVVDSQPEAEYEETVAKARKFLSVLS